mmetsp:Transcript_91859/g.262687  ORF Transcript_91859/g.262687 Transcript_91859/m.262687 type:complete len:806 (-) Transcript_91859:621-3038(-)
MAAAAPSTQATASVIWSGWLSKRTPGGSHIYRQYHKRFFVLTQDAIHYYKHPYVRDDTATAPGQRAGSVHSSTGVSALSLLKRDGNGGEDGGGSGTGEGEGDGNGNGSRGGGGRLGAPPPPPAPAPGAPAVDSFEAVDARLRSDGLSQMGLIGVKDISAILVKSDLELLLETTELPVPLKTDDPATLRTFRMGLTRALKQHASELADESARLILLKAELETRHKDEIERYQAAATASKGEAQRAEDEAARLSAEVKRLKRLLEAQPSVGMSTSAPASGASIHLLGEDAGRDGERKLAHDEGVYYSKSATPLFDKMGVEEAGLVGQLRAELVEMRKALDLANGRAAECARRAELAERQCRELQTRLFGALDAKIQEILDAERKVLEVEETNAAKLSSLDDKLTHIYNTVTSVMRVATFLAEGETACPTLILVVPAPAKDTTHLSLRQRITNTFDGVSGLKFMNDEYHLHFLDAYDYRPLEPPLVLRDAKSWVKKVAAPLLLTLYIVKIAASLGKALSGLPLPLGSLEGVIDQVTEVLDGLDEGAEKASKSMQPTSLGRDMRELVSASVDDANDEGSERRTHSHSSATAADVHRAGYASSHLSQKSAQDSLAPITGSAYRLIASEAEKQGVLEKLPAKRVIDANGTVAWVHMDNVEAWRAQSTTGATVITVEPPRFPGSPSASSPSQNQHDQHEYPSSPRGSLDFESAEGMRSELARAEAKIESLRLKLKNDTRDQRVTGVLSDLTVKSLSKRWTENRTEMEHLAQVPHVERNLGACAFEPLFFPPGHLRSLTTTTLRRSNLNWTHH